MKNNTQYVKNNFSNSTLHEQLSLIHVLCTAFDDDPNDTLSLSIASALRTLLHDTKRSTSLLTHLNEKTRMFVSTNIVQMSKHQSCTKHLGLVRQIHVGVNDGFGGESKYWALCDERYFPMPHERNLLSFEAWWNEAVFINGEYSLSRKDLVLNICNKDGGTHFDDKVGKKYDLFRHNWSGGHHLIGINSGHVKEYDNIPTRPAIRQIAYEVLETFKQDL
ncbi:MAG: hypothetical protein ACLRJC_00695 [Emergencia timonensis]|uniref:hypothetical protein n=1 Tax=Emergencia timonensis TaxID=1776384 RepID=UPI00082E94D4|nr:hypothetical protein [Emergencia timonensis]WNX89915.1 hypothetical protein RVY71_06475 [Emergencia timonensis]